MRHDPVFQIEIFAPSFALPNWQIKIVGVLGQNVSAIWHPDIEPDLDRWLAKQVSLQINRLPSWTSELVAGVGLGEIDKNAA